MDWKSFFDDLQQWMTWSNDMLQRYPITSDEYWNWFIKTAGELSDKYNNHPLVKIFISGMIEFQDYNYKQVAGGITN